MQTGRTESGVLQSYGTCQGTGKISVIMLGLIAATNVSALIYANIVAFQTRNLTVAFNESKFVALAIASILQAVLIGTPLLFLADTNTTARYVVRSVLVFVICLSVQLFIFVPKIMHGDKPMEAVGRSVRSTRAGSQNGSGFLEASAVGSVAAIRASARLGIPFDSADSGDAKSSKHLSGTIPEEESLPQQETSTRDRPF